MKGERMTARLDICRMPAPARPPGKTATETELRGRRSTPEEVRALEERVSYLEDLRDGLFEMIKDLDRSEAELGAALAKLKKTQAQLIQSSKLNALGELSAGLVHEISQPLTVIKGLAHAMLRNGAKAEPDKLELIFEASEKMERIIRHLGVFARSEEPAMSPVDVNTVIRDACMVVRETFAKHSIRTVTELAAVPRVMGSATRLEQVLINLMTNAKDAMPGGGAMTVKSSVEEEEGGRFVRIDVSDTGCGIPEEARSRVFDPFFTTKAPGAGTGLGLSISYGIVKDHNGSITLESSPERGTTFKLKLPAAEKGVNEPEAGLKRPSSD